MPRGAMAISKLWAQASVFTFLMGFTGLGILAAVIYEQQAPLPARVVTPSSDVLFTRDDIMAGQHIFQKYELMQYGTLFGHGAYLGPDFTAQYLHGAALDMISFYGEKEAPAPDVRARVVRELKTNTYDGDIDTIAFSAGQVHAFETMNRFYRDFFGILDIQRGVKRPVIDDPAEVRRLTSYLAWAAWSASAERPGKDYSYTNNWPDEPLAGNTPTADNFFWSVVSLISLLCGTGLVLFFFGRYNVLGWRRADEEGIPPVQFRPPEEVGLTPAQRATAWYFLVVAGLFLAQGLLGGINAHYHAEPGGFYGVDLGRLLPYNLSRTWHVQLALFLFRPPSWLWASSSPR